MYGGFVRFFLLLLCITILKIVYAEDRDCIHKNFPGAKNIYHEAIKYSWNDCNTLDRNAINDVSFQKRCSLFENPDPPYRCILMKNNSFILEPEPTISSVESQGNYQACYMGAVLANLRYNIAPTKTYSFSDAMCVGNKDSYKRGGSSISSLLMIANKGELLECEQQKISHKDVVLNIERKKNKCNIDNTSLYNSIAEIEQKNFNKVEKLHEDCTRSKIPPFLINEVAFERDDEILDKIFQVLKNKKMVMATVPGHEINIYGINTYDCKSGKKSVLIKTINIFDPNGIKMEVIANDIVKGIYEEHELFFLNGGSKKNNIRDIYLGTKGIVYAAGTGDANIFKAFFAEDGTNANTSLDNGITPLFIAAQNGHKDIVEKLLKVPNIDVNKSGKEGAPPLFVAAQNGYREIVEVLLKTSGIEVDKRRNNGATSLIMASQNRHKEVVEELVRAIGIDVNKSMNDGRTALFMAAQHGFHDVVEVLLKVPTIEIDKSTSDGATPLIIASENGHVDVVRALLKAPGIDVNKQDIDGVTSLIIASEKGYKEVVRELLKISNIEVNKTSDNGATALVMAVYKGNKEVIELLLQVPEVSLNIKIGGKTAEEWAVRQGRNDIAMMIRSKTIKKVKNI